MPSLCLLGSCWPEENGWFMFTIYQCHCLKNSTQREKPDGTLAREGQRKEKSLLICKPENTWMGKTQIQCCVAGICVFTLLPPLPSSHRTWTKLAESPRGKEIQTNKQLLPFSNSSSSPWNHQPWGCSELSAWAWIAANSKLQTMSNSASNSHRYKPRISVFSTE